MEITRTNGDKLNNGFTGEATNLLRSLINNRQIGITAIDSEKISPQIKFYRDTQGTTIEHTLTDFPVLGNRTNIATLENKVSETWSKKFFRKFYKIMSKEIRKFLDLFVRAYLLNRQNIFFRYTLRNTNICLSTK